MAAGLTQPQRKSSMQLPDSLRPAQLQSPYSALLSPTAISSSYANGGHASGGHVSSGLDREFANGDAAHHSAASNGRSGGCQRSAGDQQCCCGACSAGSPVPVLNGHSSSADKQPACRAPSCDDEACNAGICINGVNGAPT